MIILIEPIAAPRQVRSDTWKPRDCVLRYRAFRDELRLKLKRKPEPPFKLTFHIHSPVKLRDGKPHTFKPDIDNLTKAFLDTLWESDQSIWSVWAEKRWTAGQSRIEIEQL